MQTRACVCRDKAQESDDSPVWLTFYHAHTNKFTLHMSSADCIPALLCVKRKEKVTNKKKAPSVISSWDLWAFTRFKICKMCVYVFRCRSSQQPASVILVSFQCTAAGQLVYTGHWKPSGASSSTPASRHEYLWEYTGKLKILIMTLCLFSKPSLHSQPAILIFEIFCLTCLKSGSFYVMPIINYFWPCQQAKGTIYNNSLHTIIQLYSSLCFHLALKNRTSFSFQFKLATYEESYSMVPRTWIHFVNYYFITIAILTFIQLTFDG